MQLSECEISSGRETFFCLLKIPEDLDNDYKSQVFSGEEPVSLKCGCVWCEQ